MRKVQALAMVVFLFHALSFASSPTGFDYVEIKEALEAGLISLYFTGSEDEEKLDIRIELILSVPLIIVINKGSTTFTHSYGKISIMTNERISVDLSKKMQATIMLPQVGKGRIRGKMDQRFRFSRNTAIVYSKLKYSKDQMLAELISALDDESSWIRWGAAEALGEIRDKRAVVALKKLSANDPTDRVRNAAEEALEKISNLKEATTESN